MRLTQHSPALQETLRTARHRALTAGHPKVTAHHLLAALLEDSGVGDVIVGAGGSLPRLIAFADSGLREVTAPSLWERLVAAIERPPLVESSAFRGVLHAAWLKVRRASQSEVGTIDVLAALFQEPSVRPGIAQAGLTRLAVLRYYCHGLPPSGEAQPQPPASGRSEVVIINDHYTEMETVVRILKTAFQMKPTHAFKAMMRVHQEGQAVIGPFPTDEAVQRVAVAARMAEAEDAPLRLQLRSAGG